MKDFCFHVKNAFKSVRWTFFGCRFSPRQQEGLIIRSLSANNLLWASLLTPGSSYSPRLPLYHMERVAKCGFRSRIQRRSRDGFSPSSQLSPFGRPKTFCDYRKSGSQVKRQWRSRRLLADEEPFREKQKNPPAWLKNQITQAGGKTDYASTASSIFGFLSGNLMNISTSPFRPIEAMMLYIMAA